MKPDWDSLASTYEDSKKVVIADVDCTAGGKPLCDKYGVRGYPTIKYFNPPDEEGEDYKGGRDLPALKKFVDTELGPGCSVDTKDNCTPEQLADLEKCKNDMVTDMQKEATTDFCEAMWDWIYESNAIDPATGDPIVAGFTQLDQPPMKKVQNLRH